MTLLLASFATSIHVPTSAPAMVAPSHWSRSSRSWTRRCRRFSFATAGHAAVQTSKAQDCQCKSKGKDDVGTAPILEGQPEEPERESNPFHDDAVEPAPLPPMPRMTSAASDASQVRLSRAPVKLGVARARSVTSHSAPPLRQADPLTLPSEPHHEVSTAAIDLDSTRLTMPTDALPPISNPFATRYTRPDASEYLFPPDGGADLLIARLRESAWWGQITGPHGSGKSTLVQTLLPHLEAAGRAVDFYAFHHEYPLLTATSPPPGPLAHSDSTNPANRNLRRDASWPSPSPACGELALPAGPRPHRLWSTDTNNSAGCNVVG